MAKIERLKFNEVNKTKRLYMKIISDINKSLKVAKVGYNSFDFKEILYPLSREYNGGHISGIGSIYYIDDTLIEYVERAYLDNPKFDIGDLINDLNQFKAMKDNLVIEIENKNSSSKGNSNINMELLYNNIKIITSIVYTLESLKEEVYLKTIIKSVNDMINNIIDDKKLIK